MMAQRDFNDIYLGIHESAYRLAAAIIGGRDDAEDVVQDVYEKLWQKGRLIASSRNPEGYILACVRNHCLDELRKRRRVVEIPQSLSSDGEGFTGSSEEQRDMAAIAGKLIEALPEKQRTAMHLRDVEGFEIEEIARVMGMNNTAVRMSLSRARGTVKEKLVKILSYGT